MENDLRLQRDPGMRIGIVNDLSQAIVGQIVPARCQELPAGPTQCEENCRVSAAGNDTRATPRGPWSLTEARPTS